MIAEISEVTPIAGAMNNSSTETSSDTMNTLPVLRTFISPIVGNTDICKPVTSCGKPNMGTCATSGITAEVISAAAPIIARNTISFTVKGWNIATSPFLLYLTPSRILGFSRLFLFLSLPAVFAEFSRPCPPFSLWTGISSSSQSR